MKRFKLHMLNITEGERQTILRALSLAQEHDASIVDRHFDGAGRDEMKITKHAKGHIKRIEALRPKYFT